MSNKAFILPIIFTFLSFSNQAATFYEVTAGANFWKTDTAVQAGEVADAQLMLEQKDESYDEIFVSFEHGLPIIPNIKYSTGDMSLAGSQVLTQTYILSEQVYNVASTLASNYEYEYSNYTLYYEIFDNQAIEFDVGVTIKDIDANLFVSNADDPSVSSSRLASGTESYLYTAGKVNLYLLNLGFVTELNFQDSDNYDVEFAIQYQVGDIPVFQPYIQVGWKKQEIALENFDSLYFQHSWDAAFAGVFFTF